jgi:hypothetical protein
VQLARTLVGRPDLARKVISLELSARSVQVCIPANILLKPSQTTFKTVMQGLSLYMYKPELLGLLLAHVGNLKELYVQMLGEDYAYQPHACCNTYGSARQIFGRQLTVQEMSRIPGLAKLQRLTMFANDLQWGWCMSPLLEELTLGSHCNIGDLEHESGTLGIHTLQMDCFSTILVPGYMRHRNFSSLLQRTPRLRTLRLTICYKIYDEDNEG